MTVTAITTYYFTTGDYLHGLFTALMMIGLLLFMVWGDFDERKQEKSEHE